MVIAVRSQNNSSKGHTPPGREDQPKECSEQYPASQRNVLLIAFHFPPDASSTGRLRTLGFARHLPTFGWKPAVLTAHRRAFERVDESGGTEIPDSYPVQRAFALDTRRHLGWRGKYVSWMATPDRWISWWPDAVRVGLSMIREQRIDVIWSTYPIMTSHLVALTLSRISGLPWIADFRDPAVSDGSGFHQRMCRKIERRVVARAERVVFTTPGARKIYADRFPEEAKLERFAVVPNGYEEETFSGLARPKREPDTPCTLVHSGLLYRQGRNPAPFFKALAMLKTRGVIDSGNLRVILRASGHESEYQGELEQLGLSDIVELAPRISYQAALQEQASADGLLLFQGSEFNAQIPAKVYEYLRIGAPIIALTDVAGDTATLLHDADGALITPMDDKTEIATTLETFLSRRQAGTLGFTDARKVQAHSRYASAKRLAGILTEVRHGHEY